MIIKIDLEKAYDNISWTFLKQTLIEFDFNQDWIQLIMNCVTSVKSAILWNGVTLEEFSHGKGLRQGDPLSPYLFVLCMERLASMITHKVDTGMWKGIKASRNSPSISHLFFADDLLLFTQANDQHCDMIKDIMNEFSDISGLKIHFQKSKMYVSPNLERGRANGLSLRSGIPITQDLGKYLGVPLFHERVNKRHFNSIIEKMQKRLTGWKANTLFFLWLGGPLLFKQSLHPEASYID
jgi:hypothetical protein